MLLFVMSEKISFVVCLRQRQRQQILAPTKKSEKKQNYKIKQKREKRREMFLSLFDSFLVLCFAVRFSQPQKSEFFQIKRARENTNLARRKKFFSSSLLSEAERERERERKQNNALKVRIKEGEKTRRENPPSEYSSLFSSSE